MKLVQMRGWIITAWKKIIYQPLNKTYSYEPMREFISNDEKIRERKWPETYYRDMLSSVLTRVESVIKRE